MLSEKQESPILVAGETKKTDLSETELPVSKEIECPDNYEFQHEKVYIRNTVYLTRRVIFTICFAAVVSTIPGARSNPTNFKVNECY